jgi:hypothetical protein
MIQLALRLPLPNKPRLVYRMTAMPGMAFVPQITTKTLPKGLLIYIRVSVFRFNEDK